MTATDLPIAGFSPRLTSRRKSSPVNTPGQIVAGAADLGALGCADCKVECLEALRTQLIEGDVLADLNAGLELYAYVLYQ